VRWRGWATRWPYPSWIPDVILRHLLGDHPDHSPKATAYLRRIERRELQARLPLIVVFETVYTLQSFYRVPKDQIRSLLLPLLRLPGIVLAGKQRFRNVFALYVERNIPFPDAYIAVEMARRDETEIISFDEDFDKLPGITRTEPGEQ
jgi:predicted nucleic acid-binding protein